MRLETSGLAFGHGTRVVGRDVAMHLDEGEVVCLLGANGSGKSTLFRTLLGLIPAIAGQVLVGDRPVRAMPRSIVARAIAYVPQALAGHFPYTVEQMVLMGRTAHAGAFSAPGAADRLLAREAMSRLGLDHLAAAPYTQISGGERQLTLIARAIAQGAPLLVMDEPTASLDFGNQLRILDRIRELRARGSGILLSTHDPTHALAVCDRVLMLHDGRIAAHGTPEDSITADNLRLLYGVDVEVHRIRTHVGAWRHACIAAPGAPTAAA